MINKSNEFIVKPLKQAAREYKKSKTNQLQLKQKCNNNGIPPFTYIRGLKKELELKIKR